MRKLKGTVLLTMILAVLFVFPAFAADIKPLEFTKVDYNGKEITLKHTPVSKNSKLYIALLDLELFGYKIDTEATKNVVRVYDDSFNPNAFDLAFGKKAPAYSTVYFCESKITKDEYITVNDIIYLPTVNVFDEQFCDVFIGEDSSIKITRNLTVELSDKAPKSKGQELILNVNSEKYNGLEYDVLVFYKTVSTPYKGTVGSPMKFKIGTATSGFPVTMSIIVTDKGGVKRYARTVFVPKYE